MPIAPTTQTRHGLTAEVRTAGRQIARIVLVRRHRRARAGEMSANAGGGVLGRRDDASRAGEQPRGPPAQRRDRDVLVDQVAGIGDARLAARDVGFAAIAVLRADQSDAAAQPGVVMHMHVVRHAEAGDQVEDRRMVADHMVQLDLRAAARAPAGAAVSANSSGIAIAQVGKSSAVPSPIRDAFACRRA